MTTTDALDAIFAEWNHDASPGCAVMVLRGGQVVEARGYVHASLEYPSPITPQTVFQVASISKQFTVFAALLLANKAAWRSTTMCAIMRRRCRTLITQSRCAT